LLPAGLVGCQSSQNHAVSPLGHDDQLASLRVTHNDAHALAVTVELQQRQDIKPDGLATYLNLQPGSPPMFKGQALAERCKNDAQEASISGLKVEPGLQLVSKPEGCWETFCSVDVSLAMAQGEARFDSLYM
jgi:hypothetical protein